MSDLKSLQESIETFRKALSRLEAALSDPRFGGDDMIQDAAIRRLKVCTQLCFNALQKAAEYEGSVPRSPKEVLRKAYDIGLIDDEQGWVKMLLDRNELSHIYRLEVSREILTRIPKHLAAMQNCLKTLDNMTQSLSSSPSC